MSSRPKNPKYARNKNILVIGGSGSGKTRFFVKPSLMQMHSSYVVTDPKGQLLSEVGTMLRRGAPKLDENGKPLRDARGKVIYEPYRIKVLNTINFKKSMKYNPFAYIRSEKDILKLVNVIIANTKGDGEKSSEDFWVKAERLLYCALIGYIWYEAEPEEKNFLTLLELINASEAREDDEEFQSPVDILFAKLEKEHPDHFAVKQYRKFKLAAGKTLKSILISCGARLAPFDIAELREIMSDDELELAPAWYSVTQQARSPKNGASCYAPQLEAMYFRLLLPSMARSVAQAQMEQYRLVNLSWSYETLEHPGLDFVLLAREPEGLWQMAALGRGGQVAVYIYCGQEQLRDHLDLLSSWRR